jgi:nicotinate-nucleotide adenylyltransferase
MSAVGILGGSFNPPHLGHLALARQAVSELDLDRALIVPVCRAPHRPAGADDPGPAHRLAMCHALLDGCPGLEVSTLEVDRGGLSYTVDTLRAVHASDPEAELTVILGADVAATLPSWRAPSEILSLAGLAVAEREPAAGAGSETAPRPIDVAGIARSLRADATVSALHMGPVAVSSTLVRERLAAGMAVDDLVGAAVAEYITRNHLYRARTPAAVS